MTAPRPDPAHRATGPTTPEGKERSSLNALRHGLCSSRVVIPGEDVAQWEAFLRQYLDYFAPVGLPEVELVERYAGCQWRLRRAAAYEADVTALGLDEAERDVTRGAADCPPAPETAVLQERIAQLKELHESAERCKKGLQALERLPGLADGQELEYGPAFAALNHARGMLVRLFKECPPVDHPRFLACTEPDRGGGIKAARVRAGLRWLADKAGHDPATYADLVADDLREQLASVQEKSEALAREVAELTLRLIDRKQALERRRVLPLTVLPTLDRHEAHLERQARRALETLLQLQDRRKAREAEANGTDGHAPVRSAVSPAPAPEPVPAGVAADRVRSALSPQPVPEDARPAVVADHVRSAILPGASGPAPARGAPAPTDTPAGADTSGDETPAQVPAVEPSANGRAES